MEWRHSEPINTFQRVRGVIVGEKRIQAQHPGYWKANPLLYANEIENPYKFPEDKPFFWTQGKQVGGRSLTWGGITLRLSDNELKASTKDGYGTNWPINYSELAPHYSAIEKRLEVHGQKDGLDQLPDGDYIRGPLPFTKVEELFGEKVKSSLGHPFIHSRGFGPHRPNILNPWPRSSSPGSTLKSAIATGKVEILSEHMVERIIFNKSLDLADGVIVVNQCDGSRKKLKASLIVLCASTIQSLRILLNSEKNSNGFVNQSGKLGCNLMDHISISRFFAIPKKQNDDSVDIKSGNLEQEVSLSHLEQSF